MKQIIYILISSLLFWNCANNTKDKMYRENPETEKSILRYDKQIVESPHQKENKKKVNLKDRKVIKQASDQKAEKNFDKKKPAKAEVAEIVDYDAVSREKMQQFFDIYAVVKHNSNDKSLQTYSTIQAGRLWSNLVNGKEQLKQLLQTKYDSLKIVSVKLIHLTEDNDRQSVGNYRLSIKAYKGTKSEILLKTAKVYFESEEFMLEDRVVQVLKTKLLTLE